MRARHEPETKLNLPSFCEPTHPPTHTAPLPAHALHQHAPRCNVAQRIVAPQPLKNYVGAGLYRCTLTVTNSARAHTHAQRNCLPMQ